MDGWATGPYHTLKSSPLAGYQAYPLPLLHVASLHFPRSMFGSHMLRREVMLKRFLGGDAWVFGMDLS